MGTNSSGYDTLIPVPTELRTERLTLCQLQPEIAGELFEAVEEPRERLERWLSWPPKMQSIDDVRDYCLRTQAKWIFRTDLTYAISLTEDGGRFAGGVGLHNPDWELRTFEIGYWLRNSAVGNGYAPEAVRALTTMAFEELDARRLEIRCDADNVGSARVAERAGFTLEAHLRNADVNNSGEIVDELASARTNLDNAQTSTRSNV